MITDIFWGLFLIPLLGIIAPIALSFNENIKPTDKALLFLILPGFEILILIIAILESLSKKTNLIDTWQLQLIVILTILGLCFTLIVASVENLNNKIKLFVRLIALSILGLITVSSLYIYSR